MYFVIGIVAAAAAGIIVYVIVNFQKAEKQKYYVAAEKIIKENCLDNAIRNRRTEITGGRKLMVCLKWKKGKKQGFVFDPEQRIRIGRDPGNDICIREREVSSQHCEIYLYDGRPAIQDLRSANGTWVFRGLRKHPVQGAEYLYAGDSILVGSLKIKITIFWFDMSYL